MKNISQKKVLLIQIIVVSIFLYLYISHPMENNKYITILEFNAIKYNDILQMNRFLVIIILYFAIYFDLLYRQYVFGTKYYKDIVKYKYENRYSYFFSIIGDSFKRTLVFICLLYLATIILFIYNGWGIDYNFIILFIIDLLLVLVFSIFILFMKKNSFNLVIISLIILIIYVYIRG